MRMTLNLHVIVFCGSISFCKSIIIVIMVVVTIFRIALFIMIVVIILKDHPARFANVRASSSRAQFARACTLSTTSEALKASAVQISFISV
jgi:hypothetical protein